MEEATRLLRAWRGRFLNRSLPYAVQQPDGAYRWIERRARSSVIAAHLVGEMTVALSSLDPAGWCRWVCLDADGEGTLPQLVRLADALTTYGFPGLLEASRRGGHLWLFFAAPVPATLARSAVLGVLDRLAHEGFTVPPLEVFPDRTTPGVLGHAVRLPLGVHRKSGARYPLLDPFGTPLWFAQPDDALRHCLDVTPIAPAWLRFTWGVSVATSPTTAPIVASLVSAPVSGTTSAVIRWVDAQVSPLDLLAEYWPEGHLHKAGKGYVGWCPFHDDRAASVDGSSGAPSLYVVQDPVYGWSWRCLSTNCRLHAGPMKHSFRLYQELLGLDAAAALVQAARRWPQSEEWS